MARGGKSWRGSLIAYTPPPSLSPTPLPAPYRTIAPPSLLISFFHLLLHLLTQGIGREGKEEEE